MSIEYRILNHDDAPALHNLMDGSRSYLGSHLGFELSEELLESLKQAASKSLSTANSRTWGTFENGALIYAISGFYPKNFKTWVLHGMYSSAVNDSGLQRFEKYAVHLEKTTKLLELYGESQGYYSFIGRRPVRHQRAHERMLKRTQDKHKWTFRYDWKWEKIIKKGTKIDQIKYPFLDLSYAPTYESLTDIVLIRWTLKDEYK